MANLAATRLHHPQKEYQHPDSSSDSGNESISATGATPFYETPKSTTNSPTGKPKQNEFGR